MVWFYGGGWKHGSSSMSQFNGAVLARSGVVVVTVNYRVGFEGFGHLPGVPDNRGLLDQIAALTWVRDEIAGFGGDPGNVTVFGQSAGAASGVLLMGARAARGLFRRVIAQSIPDGCLGVEEAEEATATIAEAAGVEPSWEGFAALRPEAVLAVQDAPLAGRPEAGVSAFAPVVDGELVTGRPWEAPNPDVDLVCGFAHEEYRLFTKGSDLSRVGEEVVTGLAASLGLGPEAVAAYRAAHAADAGEVFVAMMSDALFRMPTTWTAEAHARAGGRTWLYNFAWRGPTLGACHCVDVPFVFGNGDVPYAALFLGSPPPAEFAGLSERMRSAWTSFATVGDPGWPRFDLGRRRTRIWDDPAYDADYPLADTYRVWATASGRSRRT